MREEELNAEKRSIVLLEVMKGLKKHSYRNLKEAQDLAHECDESEISLNKAVNKLEDDLMEIEMLL